MYSNPLVTKYFNSMDGHSGNTIKPLSKNEELRLFRQWKHQGDRQALDQLLKANVKFVVKVANRYSSNCDGKAIDINDLIQAGNEGLMLAVEHFKTSRKVRFITCARWWIEAYIRLFIYYNVSTVHTPLNNRTKAFIDRRKSLYKMLNERGNEEEIARWEEEVKKKYQMSSKQIEDEKRKVQSIGSQKSLDYSMVASDGTETNLHNYLHSDQLNTGYLVEQKERMELMRAKIQELLKHFSPRYVEFINMRFLREEPATLQEIGERLDISRERARQMEVAVLDEMRAILATDRIREVL